MRVITTLLCGAPDPQRGLTWPADIGVLIPWAESVKGHGHTPVVLTDTTERLYGVDVVQVEPGPNPYFHRWRVIADYLDGSPLLERVWCTDGADVVMLHNPGYEMRRDRIYVAADVYPAGCIWMRRTCPGSRRWISRHADMTLMNAGVLGGTVWTVGAIAELLAAEWPSRDQHDMAAFNRVLLDLAAEGYELEVGDPVNTVMHTWDHTHPTAWFAHK